MKNIKEIKKAIKGLDEAIKNNKNTGDLDELEHLCANIGWREALDWALDEPLPKNCIRSKPERH